MASKSKLWYLDRMDLFRHMDDSAKKWASDVSVMTELKRRTPVYLPKTPHRGNHYAEIHEDALICIFTRKDFLELMKLYPDMAFRVTKILGFRIRRLSNRVENLLFKSAHARLAQTLLELAREHGVRDADGILLTLKLSQQELGSLIGLSRESVNLCLSDFKRRGLVESSGRRLRLRDPEKLATK